MDELQRFREWLMRNKNIYYEGSMLPPPGGLPKKYYKEWEKQEKTSGQSDLIKDLNEYGVELNPENKNQVFLPDGRAIRLSDWQNLTDDNKLKVAGGRVISGVVYLPNGESVSVKSLGITEGTSVRDIIAGMPVPEKATVGEGTGEGTGKISIETINGYKSIVTRDNEGNIFDIQVIEREGQAEQEGEQARRNWALDMTRMGEERQERLYSDEVRAQNRLAEILGMRMQPGTNWAAGENNNKQLGEEWERARQAALNTYKATPDRSWLKVSETENLQNPYQEQGQDFEGMMEQANQQEKQYEGIIKDIDKWTKDPNSRWSYASPDLLDKVESARKGLESIRDWKANTYNQMLGINKGGGLPEALGTSSEKAYNMARGYGSNILQGVQPTDPVEAYFALSELTPSQRSALETTARGMGYGPGADRPEPTPEGVEYPEFLPKLVPGLSKYPWVPNTWSGKRGTKIYEPGTELPKSAAPSMQMWRGLKPAEKRQWAGYLTETGQSQEELFEQTFNKLPQSPSLGRRWTPRRRMY